MQGRRKSAKGRPYSETLCSLQAHFEKIQIFPPLKVWLKAKVIDLPALEGWSLCTRSSGFNGRRLMPPRGIPWPWEHLENAHNPFPLKCQECWGASIYIRKKVLRWDFQRKQLESPAKVFLWSSHQASLVKYLHQRSARDLCLILETDQKPAWTRRHEVRKVPSRHSWDGNWG